MTVHQPWRFPRSTEDLQKLGMDSIRGTAGFQWLSGDDLACLQDVMRRYHTHTASQDQCSSMVIQVIWAPAVLVWPTVRRFDRPQAYKHFIRRCSMYGDGHVGSTREVELVSGLPAASSTERLEVLDDEKHILSFRIVGGQHRLRNYQSFTTLQQFEVGSKPGTVVVESYVVDVPDGNTRDETQTFVDTILKCNLHSLARVCEHGASGKDPWEPVGENRAFFLTHVP